MAPGASAYAGEAEGMSVLMSMSPAGLAIALVLLAVGEPVLAAGVVAVDVLFG